MLLKAQFRNAQVREGRDWWACPAQVANAWRATRREGAVILSTPSMLRTLGSRPKFAMSRKDQSRNAQVREGRDWWACPAQVANA